MSDAFDATTVEDTNTDPLTELVGPDKKYKTPADLVKAVKHKDDHIAQLEREHAAMREDLGKTDESEAQLEALRQEILALKQKQNAPQPRDNTSPALSDADVEALVAKAITKREAANTANQNIMEANNAIIKAAGSVEKAQETVKAKAAELGLSVEYLKSIAAQSPTAFLKMIGEVSQERKVEVNVRGTVNPEQAVTNNNAQAGTKEYFDNIRRTNKKLYFSPAIQRQIIKAVESGTYKP